MWSSWQTGLLTSDPEVTNGINQKGGLRYERGASIKIVVSRCRADYSAANNTKFSVPRSAPFTISVTEWMPG